MRWATDFNQLPISFYGVAHLGIFFIELFCLLTILVD